MKFWRHPPARHPVHTLARPALAVLRHWREGVLAGVLLGLLAALLAGGPIHQAQSYHRFADQRPLLGMPNLLDTASNLPFLLVGVLGLAHCLARRRTPSAGAWPAWAALFAATFLVGLGSAWYHWAPDDASLLWDRLPMTLGFMSLFIALLAEHVHARLQRLLVPALALGLGSVLWWRASGDLRWYYWVQFGPLACIPLVLVLHPPRFTHRGHLLLALGGYVLAKLAESADGRIFQATGQAVSGHTLKHLLAAAALLGLLRMLRRRHPVEARPAVPESMSNRAGRGTAWPVLIALLALLLQGCATTFIRTRETLQFIPSGTIPPDGTAAPTVQKLHPHAGLDLTAEFACRDRMFSFMVFPLIPMPPIIPAMFLSGPNSHLVLNWPGDVTPEMLDATLTTRSGRTLRLLDDEDFVRWHRRPAPHGGSQFALPERCEALDGATLEVQAFDHDGRSYPRHRSRIVFRSQWELGVEYGIGHRH